MLYLQPLVGYVFSKGREKQKNRGRQKPSAKQIILIDYINAEKSASVL